MPYYGRQYPEPPIDEVDMLVRKAAEQYKSFRSRVEALLDDIDGRTAEDIRICLQTIEWNFDNAQAVTNAARFN